MKLEISLPQRPGLIYTMPVLDILVLVLVFPLLGSSFTTNAGVQLTLPDTGFRFDRMERSIVVTVKGATEQQIYINRRLVKERDMLEELANEAMTWQGGGAVGIIFRVDKRVPSGYKTIIGNKLLAEGYTIYDAGNPASK
jgi:biopolymer transport protein ExbD